MMMEFLGRLGLKNLTLQINSLGCASCRPQYRKTLHDWLAALDQDKLCPDCKRRLETNPLRVLDCKVPTCKELTAAAPVILENECPDCKAHFDAVLRHLDAEGVPYQINHRLVRGLDYYTRTTWEVVSNEIGSQGSVAGGGRYDGLVEQLGGPAVPGIGFACGMERLALLLEGRELPEKRPDFYVAVLDDSCRDAAFGLAQSLRRAGLAVGETAAVVVLAGLCHKEQVSGQFFAPDVFGQVGESVAYGGNKAARVGEDLAVGGFR
jgi:histidyl-tRNA synthetase